MPGNPDKEGQTGPKYQMGRRRHSKVPGYHGVLPRVFPYRVRCSYELADNCIYVLTEMQKTGFALTSHPASSDGHVHLWLSEESAEYLVEFGFLSKGMLEETE
jgi:hypothetical protein